MAQGPGWHQGPQRPWGPTPGAPGFAPPPRDPGWTAGKIACAVVVPLILLFALAIGGMAYFIVKGTAPPRDAAHAFLAKVRKGDFSAAYDLTSPDFQARVSEEALERHLEENLPDARRSDDATFNSTHISNDVACLSGTLAPTDAPVYMRLRERSGRWVIEDLSRAGVAGCD